MSRNVGTKILAITTVGVITATCGIALIYGWKSDDVVKDTLPQKDLLTLQLAQTSSGNGHAPQQTSAPQQTQQYSQQQPPSQQQIQQPQIHHVPHSFPQNYLWADPHSTHYHDPHYWDEHEAYMEYLREHGSGHGGYGMHDGYGYNAYDPYGHQIHHHLQQQHQQHYYQPMQVQHVNPIQHVHHVQPNPQQSSPPPQASNSGSLQLPPQHFNPLQPAQVKKTEETITTAHLGPLVTSLPQASSAPAVANVANAGTTSPAIAAAASNVPVSKDTSATGSKDTSTTPAPVPAATKDAKAPMTVNETTAPPTTAQPNASAVDAKRTEAKPTETATNPPSTSSPSTDPNDVTFDPLPGVLPAEKVNKVIKDRYVDITVHGDSDDKQGKVFITQQPL